MNKISRPVRTPPPPSITLTLGAVLAQGVIRLHDRQKRLDERTEERVHTGRTDTQEMQQ